MQFRLQSFVLAFTCAFALTFCFFSPVSAQDSYGLGWIAPLRGCCSSAVAINAYGGITGGSTIGDGTAYHAFLYGTSPMTDLGTLGGSISVGTGINASDEVTGYSTTATGTYHAFLYSGGTMKDLGTLGGSRSRAWAINASGQVVGSSTLPGDTVEHAFLYSGGAMKDLGTLGGSSSSASGINDAGEVTGASSLPGDNGFHAFLYSAGTMKDLGSLSGSPESEAEAINNFGQITGSALTQDSYFHAFLYSGGTMTDLAPYPGTWSAGQSINNFGQVVGRFNGPYPDIFLYTPGVGMAGYDTLFPDPCDINGCWPWEYVSLNSINDLGSIAGSGAAPYLYYGSGFILDPTFSWFSAFQAKLQIMGKRETHFHLRGSFTLGADRNGLDPLTQKVLLQLGSLPIPIQKGLFSQDSKGDYVFQGVVGLAAVDFRITPVTSTSFTFRVEGRTATPFRVTNPARFILMIGDNKTMGTLPWK